MIPCRDKADLNEEKHLLKPRKSKAPKRKTRAKHRQIPKRTHAPMRTNIPFPYTASNSKEIPTRRLQCPSTNGIPRAHTPANANEKMTLVLPALTYWELKRITPWKWLTKELMKKFSTRQLATLGCRMEGKYWDTILPFISHRSEITLFNKLIASKTRTIRQWKATKS